MLCLPNPPISSDGENSVSADNFAKTESASRD